MVEVDAELSEMLSSSYTDRMKARSQRNGEKEDSEFISNVDNRDRKLERVKRVRAREGRNDNDAEMLSFAYSSSRQERQRDLQTIDIFRDRWVFYPLSFR